MDDGVSVELVDGGHDAVLGLVKGSTALATTGVSYDGVILRWRGGNGCGQSSALDARYP